LLRCNAAGGLETENKPLPVLPRQLLQKHLLVAHCASPQLLTSKLILVFILALGTGIRSYLQIISLAKSHTLRYRERGRGSNDQRTMFLFLLYYSVTHIMQTCLTPIHPLAISNQFSSPCKYLEPINRNPAVYFPCTVCVSSGGLPPRSLLRTPLVFPELNRPVPLAALCFMLHCVNLHPF
jgi:hypothetical protein